MKEYKYTIDGEEYKVNIGNIEDNVASVTVNGNKYKVEMEPEPEPEKKKVVLGKATSQPGNEDSNADSQNTANANTANALRAPLPGVITEVCVSVGEKGDTVVVLEAMKMANNIESEKDGKVTAVLVKQGVSVMEDTPLVVIE